MGTKNLKAKVVNEGTNDIHRYSIKVTWHQDSTAIDFIKTFPYIDDRRNWRIVSQAKEEFNPDNKRLFIGIGLTSYEYVNYIKFYSTLKQFTLQKGDSLKIILEDGNELNFQFEYNNKQEGFYMTNICPISDEVLELLAKNVLNHWELHNHEDQTLLGGFCPKENNKQYISKKSGQELLKKMSSEIISAKNDFFNSTY